MSELAESTLELSMPDLRVEFATAARSALARLGVENLVLSIHQVSFPAGDGDVGYGTPYSSRATDLLRWATHLGFTGVAFGPQGITSRVNPSPYDATAFSRNPLHASFEDFVAQGLIEADELRAEAQEDGPRDRADYVRAWNAATRLLALAASRFHERRGALAAEQVTAFRARSPWLEAEARFEEAALREGHDDWNRWPSPWPRSEERARAFEIEQLLLFEQHERLRARAHALGLRLYADLPIGTSYRDRALYGDRFLGDYVMGAPPSRTNPDGQPWGYPVLDPRELGVGGRARQFLSARIENLLADYDGLRIDHPHGWVCPWVYRANSADALRAVQEGARLFESPDLPDHPSLRSFARVRPDQIDRSRPRFADDWVLTLDPDQIDRYATCFDAIVDGVRSHGGSATDLMVEVLSTCPRPLAAVLARHRMGRFRVTQKARPEDPSDVYRGDRAEPEDWIMTGNHDTPPLWVVIERWQGTAELDRRVTYLARRLAPSSAVRAALAVRLANDPVALAEAMLAELFVGPARNVLVFWPDLFGERRIYNRPGEVDPDNWTLRAPANFEDAWARLVSTSQAPRWGRVLALALAARGLDEDPEGQSIRAVLEHGSEKIDARTFGGTY